MREAARRASSFAAILLLGCACGACGEAIELRPEIRAHLDEYESLIETYEPKFAAAKGDRAELVRVADSYGRDAKAWMSKWSTVAPDLSEEEGRAIRASIDELNRRAERMLGAP